jgi:phosphatidylglycerol---prolipoprotein diacylglyceryl transferase
VLPEIDVFGLDLKTFGLFFALNFVAWGAVVSVRLRELGKPPDWAWEMVFVALVGGFIGARLYYLAQNWDEVDDDLLGSVLAGSGLIWYGGLAGGALAMVVWAWRRGFLGAHLLDLAAFGLPIGYAIGRIGCQISGDGDYGKAWGGPWAMAYPDGTVPTTDEVHPTPIYETVVMGTVGLLLWHLRDRVRPGGLFALYLVLAGAERFLVEFLRRNEDVALGLTAAQLESGALFVAGVVCVVVFQRRGGLFKGGPDGPTAGGVAAPAAA